MNVYKLCVVDVGLYVGVHDLNIPCSLWRPKM